MVNSSRQPCCRQKAFVAWANRFLSPPNARERLTTGIVRVGLPDRANRVVLDIGQGAAEMAPETTREHFRPGYSLQWFLLSACSLLSTDC